MYGYEDDQRCEICNNIIDNCVVHFAECSVCRLPGCTICLHDGMDDLYDYLCDECDPPAGV